MGRDGDEEDEKGDGDGENDVNIKGGVGGGRDQIENK